MVTCAHSVMTVAYGNNDGDSRPCIWRIKVIATCTQYIQQLTLSNRFSLFLVPLLLLLLLLIYSNFRFQYDINRMVFVDFRYCRLYAGAVCVLCMLLFVCLFICLFLHWKRWILLIFFIFFWSMHSRCSLFGTEPSNFKANIKLVVQYITDIPCSSTSPSHVQSVNGTMEFSLFPY